MLIWKLNIKTFCSTNIITIHVRFKIHERYYKTKKNSYSRKLSTMNIDDNSKNKCLQTISCYLYTTSGNDFHIVDIYFAIDIVTKFEYVLVIYTGVRQIDVLSLYGVMVKCKQRPYPDYYDDMQAWCSYREQQFTSCVSFCEQFASSSSCIQLISDHSDVIAVFPSVIVHKQIKQDTTNQNPITNFVEIIQVIVKAIGYVPLGESSIPTEILLGNKKISVICIEGYSEECVITGDAIGNNQGQSSFGSIAGVVKNTTTKDYYAVTCKHVINESVIYPEPTITLSSPPPTYRFFKMLQALQLHSLFDNNGKIIDNLTSHCLKAMTNSSVNDVKRHMRYICNDPLNTLSSIDSITLVDINHFITTHVEHLGSNSNIIYPAEQVCLVDLNTYKIPITGDIALIPLNNSTGIYDHYITTTDINCIRDLNTIWNLPLIDLNVYKLGASSGCTEGILIKPSHIRVSQQNHKSLYLNQILVYGSGFGRSGDSGSLVYSYNSQQNKKELVGIFTGNLNPDFGWVAPIQCINDQYQWII